MGRATDKSLENGRGCQLVRVGDWDFHTSNCCFVIVSPSNFVHASFVNYFLFFFFFEGSHRCASCEVLLQGGLALQLQLALAAAAATPTTFKAPRLTAALFSTT